MIGIQRRAAILFAGTFAGSCAVALAAPAYASPCDPLTMSMTPQPVLSCPAPDAPPPPDAAPGPVTNVASGPAPAGPNGLPAPNPTPTVPPVAAGDGPAAGSQLGYIRQIWHDFHNGVPSDILYGPAPDEDSGPPVATPIRVPPPEAPTP
jgi:hypothetical protein